MINIGSNSEHARKLSGLKEIMTNPYCIKCGGSGERHNGYFKYPCNCAHVFPLISEAGEQKLRLASEDQKKGGWTIDPELLEELQTKIGMYEDAPSWEGIELVLLAYHNLPLPQSDK